MSTDVLATKYEELEQIARRFSDQAKRQTQLITQVKKGVDALRHGGWEGRGSAAFFSEMDGKMYPGVQRLTEALLEAQQTTLKISEVLRQAEEEAAAPFKGNGAGGPGLHNPADGPAPGPGSGSGSGASAPASIPAVIDEKVNTSKTDYTIEGPKEQKNYSFKGKTVDAQVYTVKYKDGTQLTIVEPKDKTAGFHNNTAAQAAEAAAYLPTANRKVINTIMLNPVTNPADPDWAVKYNRPGFHSYMTAGEAGVVTIYPNPDSKAMPGDNYMRGTMIHETGHTWSYKTWGTDKTKGEWANWQKAMTADKGPVSEYAKASISEDVAETIQAYVSTKGTPKFEEYRKLYPNRWDMLDKQFK